MPSPNTTSILFLVPYPLETAPSQRFRFEQYFKQFPGRQLRYRVQSFIKNRSSSILFQPGNYGVSVWLIITGIVRRLIILGSAWQYDFVFIHREATPIGPPLIEWFLARVLRRKMIYDFDDALWVTDRVDEPRWLQFVKWRSKIASICRWSYKVSCGNRYLQEFAARVNSAAFVIPTTIDAHQMIPATKRDSNEVVVVGWTGSRSTLKYLEDLVPALTSIAKKFSQVSFLVISDVDPGLKIDRLKFIPWNRDREAEDLQMIDIGLMPLPDDEWTRGKCGFKALQYMAVGIPAIVSPVGVNTEITVHGVTGLHATTEREWVDAISKFVEDPQLRLTAGREARQKVVAHYSIDSNSSAFFSLFE